MRIAIDARYLNESYSGIAKYSENLLNHLSRVDHENEYIVFIHPSFNRRLRLADNFHIVTYPARPVSLRTLFSFGRRCRRIKCDFLHSLSPVAPILGIDRKILTIHDLQPYTIEEERGAGGALRTRIASGFHRATFPHFARQATWLISVSQATKDEIARLFPWAEHKTIVVHSGVEEIFSRPVEATVNQMVSKKLDLPQRYILYVGSARPNKNVPRMLRAFARAKAERPDIFESLQYLLVLGKDQASAECRRAIRQLDLRGNVRILGPVTEEEKRILYARATILFSVTRAEGFGLPIVEAQAAGLPILAADDGSVPEVAGEGALLVDPGDEDAMARALSGLLDNEFERQRIAALAHVNVQRFSWEETARRVVEIYNLLM